MCGLVGVAGTVLPRDEKVLKTLLTLDALRGIDSTGIAVIPRNGVVKMAKEVGNPYNLFETKSYDKALMGAHRAIIGHNRWATQGGVNKFNAHPFEFKTLVGAHNGTLKNKWKLDDHKDFDVDSENLYHHIEKNGIRDALDIIEGAWALVWWDKVKESINFLRNKERPLWLCVNVEKTCIYWASEMWMLKVALSREGVKHEDCFELTEDMHHSMHIGSNAALEKFTVVPMEARAVPFEYQGYYGNSFLAQHHKAKAENKATEEAKNQRVVPITTKRKTLTLKDSYVGSQGKQIEVYSRSVDQFGARYFDCFDLEDESRDLRLYYTSNPDNITLGTLITGDIGTMLEDVDGCICYKIVSSSVKVIERSHEEAYDQKVDEDSEMLYATYKGHLLNMRGWMQLHGTCDNCSGPVTPQEDYKFLKTGEIFCEFCASDVALAACVNFL